MDEAFCNKVISGKMGFVNNEHKIWDQKNDQEFTWWEMRQAVVIIPYFDYVEIKKWIIEECKQSGQCDARISSWDRVLENIDDVVKNKLGIEGKNR